MILLFWIVGILFIGLALPLMRRKIGPNSLYGLRVAETLEDEDIWFEANARSGRDLFRLGIGTIAISSALFIIPWRNDGIYALVCCGLLLMGVLVYGARGIRIARSVKRELEASDGDSCPGGSEEPEVVGNGN